MSMVKRIFYLSFPQNRNMNKFIIFFSAISLLLSSPITAQPTPENAVGSIKIAVYDHIENKPIANAICCIPEIDTYFYTDENGYTQVIDIPLNKKPSATTYLAKSWSNVTLLVYKDGYDDFVLYNVKVKADYTRSLERIYLYRENGAKKIHSSSELPDNDWTLELLRKYRR